MLNWIKSLFVQNPEPEPVDPRPWQERCTLVKAADGRWNVISPDGKWWMGIGGKFLWWNKIADYGALSIYGLFPSEEETRIRMSVTPPPPGTNR